MQETKREVGSIPGLGRFSGEGNGNPFQCSCLEKPMDRGTWQVTVHGVAKSRTCLTWLSMSTSTWNLERWYRLTYLQGSSGDADPENRLVNTVWEERWDRLETYITMCKIANGNLLCDKVLLTHCCRGNNRVSRELSPLSVVNCNIYFLSTWDIVHIP